MNLKIVPFSLPPEYVKIIPSVFLNGTACQKMFRCQQPSHFLRGSKMLLELSPFVFEVLYFISCTMWQLLILRSWALAGVCCAAWACIVEILELVHCNGCGIYGSNRKWDLLRFMVLRSKPFHLGLQKETLLLMFLGNRVWIDLERLSSLFLALVWNQLHNISFEWFIKPLPGH